jgi:hypothetical protein
MFIHKRFAVMGLSLVLLSSLVLPSSVNAASNVGNPQNIVRSIPQKITSFNQLKNTLKTIANSESYKQLSEDQKKVVTDEIKSNITQNVYKTLTEKIAKTLHDNKNEFSSDTGNDKQVLNVDKDTQIVVSTQDTAENKDGSTTITPFGMPEMYNVTKEYGDRKYEIHASANVQGFGIVDERLTMHYTLGSDGIKMRYSSTAGSYIFFGSMSAAAHTTDTVATHEGADVNAYADYHYEWPVGSHSDRVHGKVLLYQWYKSDKKMLLRESWYME